MSAPGQRPASLSLRWRRLDHAIDAKQVFPRLFGECAAAFWLDSSAIEVDRARFSFLGAGGGPLSEVLRYESAARRLHVTRDGVTRLRDESVFDYLERELARRRTSSPELPFEFPFEFHGGYVGYFGYELKGECDGRHAHAPEVPDACFLFTDRFLAVDHRDDATYLVSLVDERRETHEQAAAWLDETTNQLERLSREPQPPPPTRPGPVSFRLRTPHADYLERIASALRHIRAGDSYEVCLTHQIAVEAEADPLAVYLRLRRVNPAPHAAFLRFGELAVASSSPERFLRLSADRQVESKPIKGTRPRSADPERDRALRDDLATSVKDRAENTMIVDLLRNDLGRVCEVGSVHVPTWMAVESYETVHQLVSTVRGRLRPEVSAIDCIRAAFPGGSMTGAPKIRTMEILDDLEGGARGVYSGCVGFLSLAGAAELSIVIRTIVTQGGATSIGVGGAIVASSDPEEEFQETLVKARAPMRAILCSAGLDLADEDFERLCRELRDEGVALRGEARPCFGE